MSDEQMVTGPGVKADSRFGSLLIGKFINSMMRCGKKSTAERTFYKAMAVLGKKYPNVDPMQIFDTAVNNVKPLVEVKSKRVGGATYQVPFEVNRKRQQSLAIRWVIEAARKRKGKPMAERLALEPWLYRRAIRVLDDLAQRSAEDGDSVHLEESTRNRNVRGSDEAHLQYHQPDESFTEETVIPDRRVPTPEDIASTDEIVRMVELALRGAGRAEREVFILHALEGFSVDEIAVITDRKPEQVRSCIAGAREHLRKSPPLASQFASRLLQKISTV